MSEHADIIMISYNSYRFLPEFFHFIKSKTAYPFHLIVIDNHSTDQSPSYLQRLKTNDSIRERLRLILSPTNLGVAKAWNLGIDQCTGKYVVFLNPDIKLTPGWLERLVACAERHPQAAVVGAKILNYDNTIYHAGLLNGVRGRGEKDDPRKYQEEMEVNGIQGSCFLLKRAIIAKIGKFDERFFVYGEEDDYCRRVINSGYKVMYCPIKIYHYREGSLIPAEQRRNLRKISMEKFKEKWEGHPRSVPKRRAGQYERNASGFHRNYMFEPRKVYSSSYQERYRAILSP